MPPPTGGRPRVYNDEERKVIDPFKEEYMKTTSPAERKALAQGLIFPALFTYWSSIGVDLNTEEFDIRMEVSEFLETSLCCFTWTSNTESYKMVEECLASEEECSSEVRKVLSFE